MLELAGCVVLDGDGRILVLHRATPELTQWELPGGKIEPGETPQAAAVRELSEELGITVEILSKLGSGAFRQDGHDRRYHWFMAAISAGQPRPGEAKFDASRYFSLAELSQRDDLSVNLRELLNCFKDGFGPDAQSKLRRTRNELVVQNENRRVKNLASGLLDKEARRTLPLSFACECSNPDCEVSLSVSAADYTRIHDRDGWFAVAPGHEQADLEHVVEKFPDAKNPEYYIVEKTAVTKLAQTS